MGIYAFLPFLSGLIFLGFGLFIYIRNPKSKLNLYYFLVCFSSTVWVMGYSFMYAAQEEREALLYARIGYAGVVFIPAFLYNFTAALLKLKRNILIFILIYLMSVSFLVANCTDYFLNGMYRYFWGFYPKAGLLYVLYVIFFNTVFLRCAWILFKHLRNKEISPVARNQIKYVLLAFLVGMTSFVDYLPNYKIKFYPWGYISALGWIVLTAVAIFKYRLMDIKIAITRTGIFIAIYTLVLGFPFAAGMWFKDWFIRIFAANWWVVPLGIMAGLATGGPFIYIYLNRKAEERLLKEQRRYQNTLMQASLGMIRIRDLRKLLKLIVHIVSRTVRLNFASIYLLDKENSHYKLEAMRSLKAQWSGVLPQIEITTPLAKYLSGRKKSLVFEELKRQLQDNFSLESAELKNQMVLLNASVVVPSFIGDKLLGFMVLGDKLSGKIYSEDDLRVFTVLANQAALAIENARFFEDAKEMQEQISQAEKMATIGTMADGLSHQINNRFYALSLIAGDTLDTVKLTDTTSYASEQRELLSQIKYALERIQSNVVQGGEIVKGMLKYTRKGEEGFQAVRLDDIINSTLEMVQYKIKLSELDIIRDYPKDAPAINGNLTQLQEVFFNLIDNAYDAMMERKDILKEAGYRGRIRIFAESSGNGYLKINVEDNGIGAKTEDLKKMFTPFFTTKVSSHKGTGLGLYVIKKIITSNHNGKISFESAYKQGTKFILELPLYVK